MSSAQSAWPPKARPRRPARFVLAAAFALGGTQLGCTGLRSGGGGSAAASYPPADVYEIDPQFAGEWFGDVDGQRGTLNIGRLDERSYFGSFESEDGTREYTLLLDHTYIDDVQEGELPSNRTVFTWQDGLGSRGNGWLLIDQSDRAVSGSFGFGVAAAGLGEWSFIRVEG